MIIKLFFLFAILAVAYSKKKYYDIDFTQKGGVWVTTDDDANTIYLKFFRNNKYTKTIKSASGQVKCDISGIYENTQKDKSPSILHMTMNRDDDATMYLVKKWANGTKFNMQQLLRGITSTQIWSLVDAIPDDCRCYSATVDWIASDSYVSERPVLTWVENIGLAVSPTWGEDTLNVISESDGYTLIDKSNMLSLLPGQYKYIIAAFGNNLWSNCFCGDNHEIYSSSTNTYIDLGFEVSGGAALSNSIIFLASGRKITKYNVDTQEVILSVSYNTRDDLAISLDKQYLYFIDGNSISCVSTTDLSYIRSYKLDLDENYYVEGSIEITPTNLWITLRSEYDNVHLAKIILNN